MNPRTDTSPSSNTFRSAALEGLGVLRIAGVDATRFLQGQLSNDVTQLATRPGLIAGFHNPQGRVIAIVRLLESAGGDILAVAPRELVPVLHERLRRYVLRAKVMLADASSQWQVWGVMESTVADGAPSATVAAPRGSPQGSVIELGGSPRRWLVVRPLGEGDPLGGGAACDERTWRRLDIAAGLPQVYRRTSEAFVAQMLNLDLVGGIAFDKGCYTGQEVIARAHYRGRIKRRMQRLRSGAPAQLACGDAGRLADGRSFRVVEAVALDDGRCEFLAVTALNAPAADGAPDPEAENEAAGPLLEAEALPLPYPLPS